MRKFLFLAILLSISISIASGQVVQDYVFSKELNKKVKSVLKEKKQLWGLQNRAVEFSFIGNYKASIETQNLFLKLNREQTNPSEPPKIDLEHFKKFKPINAVKAIAKEASKYKIVITNEAHYQPQNRVFTLSLLKALYKKGFRYLATEDLAADDTISKNKNDTNIQSRGYAVKTTGYYISEPQYGNMVRTAINMGYTLVSYDYFPSEIKDPFKRAAAREARQAKNLAQVLEKDPKAKILVHSGYGHLNERLDSDRKEFPGLMGAMLKHNHNIDPLTIDQTTYLPEKESLYSAAISIKKPSVLINKRKEFYSPSNETILTDIKVFFPKTTYRNGRPRWLFYEKGRKYYFPKLKKIDLKYPLIVKAYVGGEDIQEAIPSDVIEIKNSNEKKALVLKKGRYTQIVKSISGKIEKSSIQLK